MLYSTQIPSVLDPRHLHRTNQKRSNGLTLVPWAVAEQLLWNVMVVDSLAPSRISAGSNCNPGTPLLKRKSKKNDKCKDLLVDGYLFQPLVFEIQGAAGPSTDFFEQAL